MLGTIRTPRAAGLLLAFALAARALGVPDATAARAASDSGEILVLTGEVTAADKGTYHEHPFVVPAGVTRLDLEFTHSHGSEGAQLEIGLFDPERFRGTSRFSRERFHLAEAHATPSYHPGAIVPGRWRVSLGIPAIAAGTRVSWRVTVRLSRAASPDAGLGGVLREGAAWYVGDFHAHTLHSDAFDCEDRGRPARRGCQPWEVVEAARARGLDFLAITDHNTTSHHADLATLQATLDSLVLLRGQELTTFRGHANVYGTSRAIDFRLGFQGRTVADVMDDIEGAGALLSINHPGRETGDRCTGCGWDAPGTPWGRVSAIEVVNAEAIEGPEAGMPFWYARLNEGHRVTGIGGSDDHAAGSPRGRVGTPATVVFASALSEAALLDGVRSGRVYVRTRGPAGPVLELTAATAEQIVPMGGIVRPASDGTMTLQVRAQRAGGQVLEVVANGTIAASLPVQGANATIAHALRLRTGDWVHVRLRDERGVTAFTNPVYVR